MNSVFASYALGESKSDMLSNTETAHIPPVVDASPGAGQIVPLELQRCLSARSAQYYHVRLCMAVELKRRRDVVLGR